MVNGLKLMLSFFIVIPLLSLMLPFQKFNVSSSRGMVTLHWEGLEHLSPKRIILLRKKKGSGKFKETFSADASVASTYTFSETLESGTYVYKLVVITEKGKKKTVGKHIVNIEETGTALVKWSVSGNTVLVFFVEPSSGTYTIKDESGNIVIRQPFDNKLFLELVFPEKKGEFSITIDIDGGQSSTFSVYIN
ncbi:MAG: hypothetical protein GXO48_05355 [Chlorobi bacterium]|nr:hypothetical protein [Chlorobiota bacterium]